MVSRHLFSNGSRAIALALSARAPQDESVDGCLRLSQRSAIYAVATHRRIRYVPTGRKQRDPRAREFCFRPVSGNSVDRGPKRIRNEGQGMRSGQAGRAPVPRQVEAIRYATALTHGFGKAGVRFRVHAPARDDEHSRPGSVQCLPTPEVEFPPPGGTCASFLRASLPQHLLATPINNVRTAVCHPRRPGGNVELGGSLAGGWPLRPPVIDAHDGVHTIGLRREVRDARQSPLLPIRR